MSLRQQFQTDTKKETEGVEIEFGQNSDGSIPTFTISRAAKSNKAYTKAIEKATRPYRRQISLGTMNEAVAEKLFMGVFIETILLGWKNVTNADVTGDDKAEGFASFTKENATALFTALPELYEDLSESANKAALFRDEQLDEEAGN